MNNASEPFRLFLCGDVMTGRGIDQILEHPSQPQLFESYVTDARDYVFLAEKMNGKINYPVAPEYIWGDALNFWQKWKPDIKIINLETAITQSNDFWPDKGIHYRMQPLNINVLKVAGINICALANNHILDWGYSGFVETLITLKNSGIKTSGAGENNNQAIEPAIIELNSNQRVLVFSAGSESSGVPFSWEAGINQPGLYYLPSLSKNFITDIAKNIKQYKRTGDLVIFSIHWGSNWGYEVSEAFRSFAHQLIDEAHVDVIFGHSSHHPRPIEIYQDKPIFYGCGDFINDYEGIGGYEEFRGDLSLMYFLDFDRTTWQLIKITLIPLQIKKMRLQQANEADSNWLLQQLNQSAPFATQFKMQKEKQLCVFINNIMLSSK